MGVATNEETNIRKGLCHSTHTPPEILVSLKLSKESVQGWLEKGTHLTGQDDIALKQLASIGYLQTYTA